MKSQGSFLKPEKNQGISSCSVQFVNVPTHGTEERRMLHMLTGIYIQAFYLNYYNK